MNMNEVKFIKPVEFNEPVIMKSDLYFEGGSIQGAAAPQTSVTYSELVELRNNAELIPGMFYRITDYQCTTTQEDTQAADHRFDIIIQALSESTLSENASADYHGIDGYFANSGLYVEPRYYIMIDESGEKEPDADYHAADVFIKGVYAENPEGETVPTLYKTDIEAYPGVADAVDTFYHIGTQEVNGVLYDKWRKIDQELAWGDDEINQVYVLTDIIVENGEFKDGVFTALNQIANLSAWELKYSLDNDTTKFAWADTENGKGVIYWMKDEWNNECPYDFKNIMFKRYKIVQAQDLASSFVGLYFGTAYFNDGDIDLNDFIWCYTFTALDDNRDAQDLSIVGNHIPNDE